MSLNLIIICCLLQVGAQVQAGPTSNPIGSLSVGLSANDIPDAIGLLPSENKPQELVTEQKPLSQDGPEILFDDSDTSEEKCDSQTINSLIKLKDQNIAYRSAYNYIDGHLTDQVNACKKQLSLMLQQQLSDMSLADRQHLDKIYNLNSIITRLMQDEIAKQTEQRHHGENQETVAALLERSDKLAIDTLSINIPQEILEQGLAIYLDGQGFASDDKKKITNYIHQEFNDAIDTSNSYLGDLESLYRALKLAAPEKLQAFDGSSKSMMINFQLVDSLSEGHFNAANVAKRMSKKANRLLSRLGIGHSGVN